MLIISCEEHHEKVHCDEEEIILSGPPSSLTGYITFQNNHQEDVFIKDLSVKHNNKHTKSLQPLIGINTLLSANEVKSHFTHVALKPTTPSGTYHSKITVGGKERKLKMIVQEHMEIELIPKDVTFMGIEADRIFNKEILLVNKGNVPIVVPTVKHNTTLDMDLICRNLSLAVRATGDQGTNATLDHFIKGLKKDIVGWVEIVIKEAGQIVAAGKTMTLHIQFKLPKDINEQRLYEGEIRILDQELDYRIIQSSTQSKAKPKRKTRTTRRKK